MARAILELIGDPDSLLRSFRKSSEAADKFGGHLKGLSVTAEQSARAQVEATVRKDARLRQEISTYKQVASAAKHGSREQIAAANLATRGEERLSRSLAITSREAKAHARSVAGAERELSRFSRGALSGSGLARSLGRSLAFASGGFLAFASGTQLVRSSIDAATEAAAVERQLAAQFRANGEALGTYKTRIDAATLATSRLSGFTGTELTQAFTTAYRGSKNVEDSLKIQSVAADVARGRHKGLAESVLALTKAYGGQATALRRLGILVPPTLKGMAAIEFVARRFAGQAQAGTTAQERFAAALHNTEVTIGSALLPSLNKYLHRATVWLGQAQNQRRIQKDVNEAVHTGASVIHGFADALHVARAVLRPVVSLLGGAETATRDLAIAMLILKARSYAAAAGLQTAGVSALVASGEFTTAEASAGLLLLSLRKLATIGAVVIGVELLKKTVDISRSGKSIGQKLADAVEQGFTPLGVQHKVIQAVAGKKVADLIERGTEDAMTLGLSEGIRHFTRRHPRIKIDVDAIVHLNRKDFQPGRSPQGPGAFPAAAGAAKAPGPVGFKARFADLELKLAQAELTKTQADDKKILRLEAALLRERIKTLGTSRKTLAERTQLTQQLVGVEGQITSIDQDAASKAADARRKRLAAERKRLAEERKRVAEEQKAAREAYRLRMLALRDQARRLAAEKSADAKELAALKQRDRALASKIKQLQESFKSAVVTAREGIGELFSGPVLNFSDEQRKAALGIPNTAADPKALVKDLNAQVRQAAAFQRNLARLSKRGAPAGLIKELQAGGVANATEVQALAGASKATLKEFFKAFGGREKLVQTIARAEMHAQLVTLHADRVRLSAVRAQETHIQVFIDGVEQKQAKVRVKQSAAQRRGPVPGRS